LGGVGHRSRLGCCRGMMPVSSSFTVGPCPQCFRQV
jgi:hypothetical protein